jgi:hypothetical protein
MIIQLRDGETLRATQILFNSGEDFISHINEGPESYTTDIEDIYSVSDNPVPTSVNLYQQVKNYILSSWSKHCITRDDGVRLEATNGNRAIIFLRHYGSTPFLWITSKGSVLRFKGYIRNIEDFKLLFELTSTLTPF